MRSQKKRSLHGVNEHFFDDRNAAGGHYGQIITQLKPLVMSSELIEYLAGFIQKRRLDNFDRVLENRTRYINIVCEDIYQGHNASAILRTCDCFGIQDVHVIEARNSFEVNSEVALGSSNWLSIHRHTNSAEDLSELFEKLRSQNYRIVATTPHREGVSLRDFDLGKGPVSLVFGTEKDGLSKVLMEMADEYMTIDMYGFTESFNVSVSAGIILHYLRNELTGKRINWHLSESEKQLIKLDWLKKSLKRSELIEKEFYSKNCWREVK